MNDIDIEKFNKVKEVAESFYKNIGEIFCPYFKENVIFNAKGFEHLKFKTKNHARSQKDQFMRFKLLHLAPKVISLSRTIQGISHTKNFEYVRSNARTETVLIDVSYYEFIAILDDEQNKKRIRVVIKQIQNSQKYFWSIIPFWKRDKTLLKRRMHSGGLEYQ